LDQLVELAHRLRVMVLERDQRVGEDRQADRRRLEQRRVAGDEAGVLEAPQPPPARRGRKPDALGELLVRDARVRLQLLEDLAVEAIERARHFGSCFSLAWRNNIAKESPN